MQRQRTPPFSPVLKKIFLSHKTQDKPLAEKVKKALESLDFEVWYDVTALYPGDQWPKAIAKGVSDTDVMVVMWTKEAAADPHWIEFEYNTALALRKPVIPVWFQGIDLPLEFSAFQAIRYADPAQTALEVQRRKVNLVVGEGPGVTRKLAEEIGKIREADAGKALERLSRVVPEEGANLVPSMPLLPHHEMVYVQGGTFNMGSNESDDEKPIHPVTLSDFEIGKYLVTQKLWRRVMGADPPELRFEGCDDCPAERVSWKDAQEFIKKLNQITKNTYRLPTEAEWEFAARGGNQSKNYKYAGGNELGKVAWVNFNSENQTHPVGGLAPNELGLFDLSGNVWEWCEDWYDVYYYKISPQINPQGPIIGNHRVVRGGSFFNDGANQCSVSFRSFDEPGSRDGSLGFRLARTLP